ncbi:hypothetical protein [Oleiharenicola lentus]|uniref:hypothetical protein n=1 Tax=Oleiharenicola lentus TaxID=2508720 RepID=UPI003F6615F0
MRSDQQIRVNGLLLQREELFVRIHEIEGAVSALLGEPYPFTRLSLPSDQRAKRKPATRASAARDPLRRLEGLEVAYRVTYRRAGQTVVEEHDEIDALRTLLASQGTSLQVTLIETTNLAGHRLAVLVEENAAVSA